MGQGIESGSRQFRRPRVITEKRREQNRLHQERFREKKRQRQQQQIDDIPHRSHERSPEFFRDQSQGYIPHSPKAANPQVQNSELSSLDTSPQTIHYLNDGLMSDALFDYSLGEGSDSYFGEDYTVDAEQLEADVAPELQRYGTTNAFPATLNLESTNLEVSTNINPQNQDQLVRTSLGSSSRELLISTLEAIRQQKSFKDYAVPPFKGFVLADPVLVDQSDGIIARSGSDNNIVGMKHTTHQHGSRQYIADPMVNHLRLHALNLVAACLANASMLGVEVDLAACRARCGHGRGKEHTTSPIWQLKELLGDASAVLMTYENVSRDLRPLSSQIEVEHSMYIDLIPFPTFRQRVIAICGISPAILDENELCNDLHDGGLVCWGGAGTGTPWDMRSWEARPWFLKKWWMLTGGKDDAMYQQSKWYWDLQGLEYD